MPYFLIVLNFFPSTAKNTVHTLQLQMQDHQEHLSMFCKHLTKQVRLLPKIKE